MLWWNSPGRETGDGSVTPGRRRPFRVKATVAQRLSESIEARTASAECTLPRMVAGHPRPATGRQNGRNSYRAVSPGAGVSGMCWISSKESIVSSLHLVQYEDYFFDGP